MEPTIHSQHIHCSSNISKTDGCVEVEVALRSLSLPFLKRCHKEREREREMTVELQVPSPSWNSNGRLERTANTMSSRSFDIVKKPRLIDLFHMEGLPENHLEFLNMPLPISHDRFDSWISTLNSTCASVTCRLPQKIAG